MIAHGTARRCNGSWFIGVCPFADFLAVFRMVSLAPLSAEITTKARCVNNEFAMYTQACYTARDTMNGTVNQ